jgi:hypothetical protein
MKKLEDGGVKINHSYAAAPAQLAPLKPIAYITDPWGTYIELNEGFHGREIEIRPRFRRF